MNGYFVADTLLFYNGKVFTFIYGSATEVYLVAINNNMTVQFSILLNFATSYFGVSGNNSGLYLDAWSDLTARNYLLKVNVSTGGLVWNYEVT